MPIGHCGNNRILILEIAINQTDANPGFGTDVVHAGLVEASFGEADQGGIEDLGASILAGFYLGGRHDRGKMNERSCIVRWDSKRILPALCSTPSPGHPTAIGSNAADRDPMPHPHGCSPPAPLPSRSKGRA